LKVAYAVLLMVIALSGILSMGVCWLVGAETRRETREPSAPLASPFRPHFLEPVRVAPESERAS
jgi:hypothetical protein